MFLALCQALHRAGGLNSLAAINQLLQCAEQGALHTGEIGEWFPSLARSDERIEHKTPAFDDNDPLETVADAPIEAWAQHFIARVSNAVQIFERAEARQAAGVIILATLLLASTWRSPGLWRNHWLDAAVLVLAQWACNLLLAWPPSGAEGDATGSNWRWLKLYRLSGTSAGVMVTIGLLFFGSAFHQVVFGAAPAGWLSFVLTGGGVIFAYAGGLKVQAGASQVEDQNFYRRASSQVTLFILIAQALLPWFFVAASEYIATGYLAVMAIALILLWPLLRWRGH